MYSKLCFLFQFYLNEICLNGQKKRSSQRNGEISRVASMSNHSHSGRYLIYMYIVNFNHCLIHLDEIEMCMISVIHVMQNAFDFSDC